MKNKKLTRRDLAESIVGATGLSRGQADHMAALVLDHLCLILARALKSHNAAELTLRNFGRFRVASQTCGGRDFRSGRPFEAQTRRRINFRPAAYFRQIVQSDKTPGK